MQRMTDALSRMLNDPTTRRAMRTLQASRDRAAEENQDEGEEQRQEEEGAADELQEQQSDSNVLSESATEERPGSQQSQSREEERPATPSPQDANEQDPPQEEREDNQISTEEERQASEESQPTEERPEPEMDMDLPGPSGVVTHPGNSSTDPVTGQRQRRRGVSAPPTGITFNLCLYKLVLRYASACFSVSAVMFHQFGLPFV